MQLEGAFYPIPSEPKEPGWNAFMDTLPTFMEHRRPTGRELKVLHRLLTTGVDLPEYGEGQDFEHAINIVLSAGNGNATMELIKQRARLGIGRTDLLRELEDGRFAGVRAKVHAPRRGHLRKSGKMYRLDDAAGEGEIVYGSHLKPLTEESGEQRVFLGLAKGLDEAYEAMCAEYDRRMAGAKTLDEKLAAIAFFQLLGVSVVHPFWDANGRAFNAHLVLELNRLGFPVKETPELGEINLHLNYLFNILGARFLRTFCANNRFPLLDDQAWSQIAADRKMHELYMSVLKDNILLAIYEFRDSDGPYAEFVEQGVAAIKVWLGKAGFIERGFYDEALAVSQEVNQSVLNQMMLEFNVMMDEREARTRPTNGFYSPPQARY